MTIEPLLVDDPTDTEDWRESALCAQTDPALFFPDKGGSAREAKRLCASCDVRIKCLESALDNDERHGIWGGLSERELRKIRRARVAARKRTDGDGGPAEPTDAPTEAPAATASSSSSSSHTEGAAA
jgi:WhiB family redox-sensing transcriptional regulator